MVLRCSVVGCSTVRGRGTASLFRFPVPCPLSWISVVGRGGKTINKYSDILSTKFFYLEAYTGFQTVGALCFKILYLTEQSRPTGILYCHDLYLIKSIRF